MILGDIVERNALRHPRREALRFPDAATRTWGQLAGRCNRLAHAVRARTAPGDVVAILAENCSEYFECYYGVPDSGRALALLNYRLHAKELVWILNDCQASVLIAARRYAEMVADLRRELPALREVVVIGEPMTGATPYEDLLRGSAAARPPAPADTDPAWTVYTSGTTGRPKGAVLTHRNLCTSILQSAVHYAPSPHERFLNAFPMCHVAGYMAIVNQFRGGLVVQQGAWDPEQWLRMVQEHRVTSAGMAPSMMTAMLSAGIDRYDLSSLTALGYGSAPLSLDVLHQVVDRFGPIVFTGYGMTETGGNALALDRETHARAARGEGRLLASAGAAMCLNDVKVVDPDGMDCPTGEIGEILVRGEQTTVGYLGRPEATAEAYSDGWLRTGDLARRDDEGFFYIVDRKKDMILTGGENVYSIEVENVLDTHPAVSESAVVGLPDPQWGEAVTAVVVLHPGAAATADELVAHCRANLAGYKRPRHVLFTDAIPRTVTGKARKSDLRQSLTLPGE